MTRMLRSREEMMAEADRRAAIIDEYLSIPLPTREDDGILARDLGIGIDAALKLAGSWRRDRSLPDLVGTASALLLSGPAPRTEVMAEDIDLSTILPHHRDRTLSRIRIIQSHLADMEEGRADLHADARRAGLTSIAFRKLVQTWLVRPEAGSVGRRPKTTAWRKDAWRRRRLDLIQETMADHPSANRARAYRIYARRCSEEGIEPVSLKRFYAITHVPQNGTDIDVQADAGPTRS